MFGIIIQFLEIAFFLVHEQHILSGYPEQFDITFDFVPRMCDKGNCALCPYGKDIKAIVGAIIALKVQWNAIAGLISSPSVNNRCHVRQSGTAHVEHTLV